MNAKFLNYHCNAFIFNMNSEEKSDLYRNPVVKIPPLHELRNIDADLKLKLSEEELKYFHEHLKLTANAYERINEICDVKLPVKYPRTPGEKSDDEAWYWKCDIKGSTTGRLVGKKIGIKDNVAVAGVPMMNGSKILEGYTPEFDATIITRILNEGGNIVGKTVCEDMCYSGNSWTSSTGPVKNPFNDKYSSGGSSSGSGVLLARKEIDMAIGCDQAGSIRLPASWCGIVGLKPTHGLVPYTGICAMEPTLDHVGPMARTVQDCALLLEVIAGYDEGRDPRQVPNYVVPTYSKLINQGISRLKIGFLKEGFEGVEEDVATIVRGAALRLSGLGAIINDVTVPLHDDGVNIWTAPAFEGIYQCMVKGNGAAYHCKGYYPLSMMEAHARGFNLRPHDMSVTTKIACVMGEYMSRNYQNKFYAKAQNAGQILSKAYDEALNTHDVLIMPTTPTKPFLLPTQTDSVQDKIRLSFTMIKNTAPFDVTGHPALSINVGFSEGLPVGMMIVGRKYDEVTVLKIAQAIEDIRDVK